MLPLRRLVLLLCWLPLFPVVGAATSARAESCVFQPGVSTWGPVATVSGAGLGGSCTPDALDDFTIPAGATVSCAADIALGPSADFGQIDVEAGGAFVCRTQDGVRSLGIGWRLVCRAGSQCTLQGEHMVVGVPSPSFSTPLPASDRLYFSGSPVPCGGWDDSAGAWVSDCDEALLDPGDRQGSVYQLALVYDYAALAAVPDWQPTLAEIGAQVAAGYTMVMTFEDDDALLEPDDPADELFQYPIVEASDDWDGRGTHGVLILEVSQSDPEERKNTAYPLAERAYRVGTLHAALPGGSVERRPTYVETDDAVLDGSLTECIDYDEGPQTCLSTRHYHPRQAQWIAFDCAGNDRPCAWFKIARTRDASDVADVPSLFPACSSPPCDRIEIYDPRGLPYALAAGTKFWISPAPIREGDPFSVQRRLRFHVSGGQAIGDTQPLRLLGDGLALDNLVIDDAPVLIRDASFWTSSYVYVRDPYWGQGTGGQTVKIDCGYELTLDHWQMVGGPDLAFPAISSTNHGFELQCDGGHPFGNLHFSNIAMRYIGDDHWVYEGPPMDGLEIDRARLQLRSLLADSASAVQVTPGSQNIVVRDLECSRCLSVDFSTEISNGFVSFDADVQGVLLWNHSPQLGNMQSYSAETNPLWRDLFVLGAPLSLPNRARNLTVALGFNDAYQVGGKGFGMVRGQHDRIENLLLRDLEVSQAGDPGIASFLHFEQYPGIPEAAGVALENAMLWSVGWAASGPCADPQKCTLLRIEPPVTGYEAFQYELDRVGVLWRPGETPRLGSLLSLEGMPGGSAGIVAVEGLLVAELADQGGGFPQFLKTDDAPTIEANFAATTAGPCLWQVDALGAGGLVGSLPASTVDAVDPQWQAPAAGVYESTLMDSLGCGPSLGALSPGLHGPLRMESWMQVPAESAAGIGIDRVPLASQLLANGLAPPVAANSIADNGYEAFGLFVRNLGCPLDLVRGQGDDPCTAPGAPTEAELLLGATLRTLHVGDDSRVRLLGASVLRDVEVANQASLVLESGDVTGPLRLRDSGRLTMVGGTLAGPLVLSQQADASILGGVVAGPVRVHAGSTLRLFGNNFQLDGVPIGHGEYGGVGGLTGQLTGALGDGVGDPIDVTLLSLGGATLVLAAPQPVPALPGWAGLLLGAILAVSAARLSGVGNGGWRAGVRFPRR